MDEYVKLGDMEIRVYQRQKGNVYLYLSKNKYLHFIKILELAGRSMGYMWNLQAKKKKKTLHGMQFKALEHCFTCWKPCTKQAPDTKTAYGNAPSKWTELTIIKYQWYKISSRMWDSSQQERTTLNHLQYPHDSPLLRF